MELTKEQLQEIDNYISVCGIKYFDVRTEIVDHFASIIEVRLETEPNLHIRNTVAEEHKKFSDDGFKKLLETKTKNTHKRFYKSTFTHLKSFFKFPKVIISIAAFYSLVLLMNLFQNKEDFFYMLTFILFAIYFYLVIKVWINEKKGKTPFIVLKKSDHFIMIFMNVAQFFHLGTVFRSDNSFNNLTYNYIQIAVYVLILLFYWSGEYVYYKNKQEIKKQYPNVFV